MFHTNTLLFLLVLSSLMLLMGAAGTAILEGGLRGARRVGGGWGQSSWKDRIEKIYICSLKEPKRQNRLSSTLSPSSIPPQNELTVLCFSVDASWGVEESSEQGGPKSMRGERLTGGGNALPISAGGFGGRWPHGAPRRITVGVVFSRSHF